jgi:hypothetical protein
MHIFSGDGGESKRDASHDFVTTTPCLLVVW